MVNSIEEQLIILSKLDNFSEIICSKLVGLEKESLRYFRNGELANNNHPKSLGSSLTHPSITTDYAESQLELITKPYHSVEDALKELNDIHSFINQKIGQDQLLWPLSMPGNLPRPKDIMTAKFGSSIRGQIKELYRTGLSYRYGKMMQLICGIHFNFSFSMSLWPQYFKAIEKKPDWSQKDINLKYMATIRNYMRISWLPTYLFGSSPIINSKFINRDIAIANYLKPFKNNCYMANYGTSIRESNLGYHNKPEVNLRVSYNTLEEYAHNIHQAVLTEDEKFAELGKYRGNKQIQINCNTLQIENEYYDTVRPKPDQKYNNSPVFKTLLERGIHYLELRNLDLDPFSPTGITLEQCLFMEVLLYYCLLKDSTKFELKERISIKKNVETTALLGRQPGLLLKTNNSEKPLVELANDIFQDLIIIANYLDQPTDNKQYSKAISHYQQYISNSELTPSARINNQLIKQDIEYTDLILTLAQQHSDYFKSKPLTHDKLEYYEKLALDSIAAKQQQEAIDKNYEFDMDKFFAEHYA